MGSYRQIVYHITFRTKNNIPAIVPEHKVQLYKYIWGIIRNKNWAGQKATVPLLCLTRNKQTVINYIKNQEEHHKKISPKEEFIRLLKEQGVNYDEKYLDYP